MKRQTILLVSGLGLALPLFAQTTAPTGVGSRPAAAIERAEQAREDSDARSRAVMEALARSEPPPPFEAAPTAAPAVDVSGQPAAGAVEQPRVTPPPGNGADVFIQVPDPIEVPAERSETADTISVDFPDEDVRVIIRNVADLFGLNVVIPQELTGRVSLKLRDVTWPQLFQVILEPLNYTYITDRNIILIRNRNELLQEPVDTRVFVVNFSQAAEIRDSIAPLVDAAAGGRIQVDRRSNALVITERPSRFNGIQQIIETLDRPTEQVMIESKFIEISNRDVRNLGVDWQSLAGFGVRAGPIQRDWERLRTPGESTETITQGTTLNPDGTVNVTSSRTRTQENPLVRAINTEDTAVFSADAFQVLLSALENKNESRLVSNPTIVTMNNTPAQINIGEEYPIPAYTFNAERGTFEVSGFEYKPIGILLNVTPQVNSAGFINMRINPEISSRTGEVNFGGASGAVIPIVTTRRTESSVTIKSGFTLAIGGLIEQVQSDGTSQVPVLGNIPVLGRLFSSESRDETRRNLVIFITARILSATGASYQDVFSQRTLYRMGVSTRDIPGQDISVEESRLYEDMRSARGDYERLMEETRLRRQLEALQQQTELKEDVFEREEQRQIRRRNQ
ncbi:MAG: hypothetical protein JJT96_03110 [Opitutales bacterium]|nr:hypothetical protein [Opitutales bacterium]